MRNDAMLQIEMTVSDARLTWHALKLWLVERATACGEGRITSSEYDLACEAHDRIIGAIGPITS